MGGGGGGTEKFMTCLPYRDILFNMKSRGKEF